MALQSQIQAKLEKEEQEETTMRLTAPQHITYNRFEEHVEVEGYEQDRNVTDYYGCDRLMKLETMYGRIQLAYDPRKGQSFIFANIRTSILDTAASQNQRKMKETMMMKSLKTGSQNVAFSSRRQENSSVMLYKMENKPWTEGSVRPYLNRINLQALKKAMPFLQAQQEMEQRSRAMEKKKAVSKGITAALSKQDYGKAQELRSQDTELLHRMDKLGTLIYRKQSQTQNFFHKANMAFDLQKMKMFDYYRNMRERRANEALNETVANAQNGDEDEDE